MADNIDILLDNDNEDKIENGDFAVGNGILDDCNVILKLNSGALKFDPILAPNIIRMINSKQSKTELIQEIKLNLNRDNKFPKKIDIIDGAIKIEL